MQNVGNILTGFDSRASEDGDASAPDERGPGQISTGVDASVVAVASGNQWNRRHWRPIPVTLFVSVIGMTTYAAYERLGTTANADSVEFTQNLAGGFLAVGMTKDQPGFIVLSALDREMVEVNVVQAVNRIAGTHTVVEVRSPREATSIRLRGPEVILVSEDGAVRRHDVAWTVAEFNAVRKAVDCSHEAAVKKHRCGAPFADLNDFVAAGQVTNMPGDMRSFLNRYRRK